MLCYVMSHWAVPRVRRVKVKSEFIFCRQFVALCGMAISPSRRLLYLGRNVMCASAAAQECPRRATSPLCPRSPPRRCQIHLALRSYMQLDTDPRCTRSTSSEHVLTFSTGRNDFRRYYACSRVDRGAPIFMPACLKCKGCFGGLGGSNVAQLSTFFTRGVGFFGTIGFTGIMDRFVRRLALAGVLQHEQAADCS